MKKKNRNHKKKTDLNFKKNDQDILTLLTTDKQDSVSLQSSCPDFHLYPAQRDPLSKKHRKKKKKIDEKQSSVDTKEILPSVSVRLQLEQQDGNVRQEPYKTPHPKGFLKAAKERRRKEEKKRNFCHYEVVKVPSPINAIEIKEKLEIVSPEVSKAKVMPRRPSFVPDAIYPYPPTASELEEQKPKSGIFINVAEEVPALPPEKELKKFPRKRPPSPLPEPIVVTPMPEDEWGEDFWMDEEAEDFVDDTEKILERIRRKVSQTSAATSVNTRDYYLDEEVSWERLPVISRLVQTFREEQEEAERKQKKRYRRGTLQSHSFTKLKQKTMREICFKLIAGSIHQGDSNYSEVSRNRQGICMPIAAYCYACMKSPKLWSEVTVDDVVDIGNRLYLDSIGSLHMHADKRQLKPEELHKYIYIGEKKIRFQVDEPDLVGYVRSTDRRVYNITKGMKLFFQRNVAGIIQAGELNVAVWKAGKKYFYLFDAAPRAGDLCEERTGTAVLAKFCKFRALLTVFLDRSKLGNTPFTISPISIKKILGRTERDEEIVSDERSNYNILNENKAVVQGSFDLGDKCFEFTRKKQATAMAVAAIIYSRITPACNWRRRTVDKIMVIGNQLFLECSEAENTADVSLEHIPAVFSVGPYLVEVFIYANRFANLMYKKGACHLQKCLGEFFEKNTNAIVQIGKHVLAIFQQRNTYFLFDPYTRNNEALKCRTGTACVSMYPNQESLLDTITTNFDNNDLIFHLHALKVLKIHRDVQLSRLFPKGITMSDIPVELLKKNRVKKSKKKAIEKPVTTDFTQLAMKKTFGAESPGASIYEIGSDIASVPPGIFPPLPLKIAPKQLLDASRTDPKDLVADLDSPSLSDTQIEPSRPSPTREEEEIMLIDLDAYDLTLEELEMQHGEDEFDMEGGGDYPQTYMARSNYSQAHSISLESYHRTYSAQVNTDLTYNYKILPAIELPGKYRESVTRIPQFYISASRELEKKTNFRDCLDGNQIIRGTKNIVDFTDNVDTVAPYVCIMALALSEELPISAWSPRSVDFVLKVGKEVYDQYQEPYHRIEDFHMVFIENDFLINLDPLLDTYVGNDLFSSPTGNKTLQELLQSSLLNRTNMGILVTPLYSCAILFFNSLYYIFDCYGSDAEGISEGPENTGSAHIGRFGVLEELVLRIMKNKNKRDAEDALEYVRLVVLKPNIIREKDGALRKIESSVLEVASTVETSQSEELAKETNFVDLPDDSQIIRGRTNISNYEMDVEFMAPFVSIMAACVSQKYAINSWTRDIIDYVLQCGSELYIKSKVRFDQVPRLDIPRVSLGKTDYRIEVDYVFNALMKHLLLEKTLDRVLFEDCEWILVVTQFYSCAVYFKKHLYYLYDGFGANEIGLGEGGSNTGMGFLARFKDLHSMVSRIIHNKTKREPEEHFGHTRFVLSVCKVRQIEPETRDDETLVDQQQHQQGEDEVPAKEERKEEKEEKKTYRNRVGYQTKDDLEVIEGARVLSDRNAVSKNLKEDHFVCLVAMLNVIATPMDRWDTKRVDNVVEQGTRIFSLADSLEPASKRTIKNILIGTHFFDVIVKKIKIENWRRNRYLEIGLDTVLRKRRFCMIQFPNCTYSVYKDEDDCYHLFDPYGVPKTDDDDDDEKEPKACWIRFADLPGLKKYVRGNVVPKGEDYSFYTFAVISVRPAPKEVLIPHKLALFASEKKTRSEVIGKAFYEQDSWLRIFQVPWSRMNEETACGKPRGKHSSRWYNWDVEYPNDLFSLIGTSHQVSRQFQPENRGKQTLANLVTAVGMTSVYEFSEWNSAVLDSILVNGDEYFERCVEEISETNYELAMEDLKEDCGIFPYSFQVSWKAVVSGTMFLVNVKKFNLYKALRYFFDRYDSRFGLICAVKGEVKRFLAFGKVKESEYFMYDCQAYGPPMFWERQGFSYVLRCRSLNRLLFCLVVTLKGGDFFIYDVETYNFQPLT